MAPPKAELGMVSERLECLVISARKTNTPTLKRETTERKAGAGEIRVRFKEGSNNSIF